MTADRVPFGCTFCGIDAQQHGRQWTEGPGWHAWTVPTDSQIRIRMLNRRRERQARIARETAAAPR